MIVIKKLNEIKTGVILTYIILGVGFIIPLLYTPVMLNLMGQTEYGLYSLTTSVVGYLSLLSFGIGTAIVRYITLYRVQKTIEELRQLVGMFLTIYSVIAVLMLIVGGGLTIFTDTFFGNGLTGSEIAKMRVLMIIMTINTAISFPFSIFIAVVTAYEKFITQKLISLIETILTPVINILVLYAGFRSVGMAIAALLLSIIHCVVYFTYVATKLKIYPSFKNMPFYLFKELLVFSGFIFLSSIVDMFYWATDKVLIGAIIGSAAVAVYNIGNTFNTILQKMTSALSGIFAPRIMGMVGKDASPSELSAMVIRIGRLQYLIVSLILSGFIVFGQKFIVYWAGEGYEEAYAVALLTMIPLSIPLIQNTAFNILLAQNKHKFRAIIYACVAVLNIISTFLILPYYGIIGAAMCTAIAFVLGQGIIMNVYYYKVIHLDIPFFWKNIGKMTVVPVLMIIGGVLFFKYVFPITSLTIMLMSAGVFTIIFVLLSWFISMNTYERQLFGGLVRKLFRCKQ